MHKAPRTLRAPTVIRTFADTQDLHWTIQRTGSAVTHLSVMGVTIVKGQ